MTLPPGDALWTALTDLAQLLFGEESVNSTLQRVAAGAVTLIDAVGEAGVTIAHDDRPATDAATGGLVYEVDNYQYEVGQGPCLTALLEGRVVEIPCMGAEHRWPAYADFAAARGIGSSLSVPLTLRPGVSLAGPVVQAPSIAAAVADGRVGVLNFYAEREGPFADQERRAARLFADQAAVALYNARVHEAARDTVMQLQTAMSSRAVIEQAKGIVMARRGCSPDDAFNVLREESQRRNQKLRDLARDLVASVERPDAPVPDAGGERGGGPARVVPSRPGRGEPSALGQRRRIRDEPRPDDRRS